MTSSLPGPVDHTDSIRLALHSWPDVDRYLQTCKGVIIPLGSTEQHGPTGAIGTDALTAEAVALELGRRSGVLVTPVQSFGMAEHHLGFAGTMSLQPATLLAVLHDLVLSLATHGFERILVVNGHGGNMATTRAAFAQAYGTAASRGLEVAPRLRCKLSNRFLAGPVLRRARELSGARASLSCKTGTRPRAVEHSRGGVARRSQHFPYRRMSNITADDVRKVAHLARLDLPEATIATYTGQLERILDYVDQLQAVDTEGVPATTRAVEVVNVTREDIVKPTEVREALLDQAPLREGDFFRVPKILAD